MRPTWLIQIVALASGVILPFCAKRSYGPTAGSCGEHVDIQIQPDKRVYQQGAAIRVRFLVTNTDEAPLYLFRSIDQCSSPLGWLSLQILDPDGKEVPGFNCAVDYLVEQINPAQWLSDSKFAVLLRKDDVFGKWQEYKLPKRAGLYRLQGEIGPVGVLSEDQEKDLSEHHMRILRHTCFSTSVIIEVK